MFQTPVNVDPGKLRPRSALDGHAILQRPPEPSSWSSGSLGTHHPTAGDITVAKGDGFTFYNDGVSCTIAAPPRIRNKLTGAESLASTGK